MNLSSSVGMTYKGLHLEIFICRIEFETTNQNSIRILLEKQLNQNRWLMDYAVRQVCLPILWLIGATVDKWNCWLGFM